jgi:uncharacterized membrane protein
MKKTLVKIGLVILVLGCLALEASAAQQDPGGGRPGGIIIMGLK